MVSGAMQGGCVCENAALLRSFKRIATLQDVDLERPDKRIEFQDK